MHGVRISGLAIAVYAIGIFMFFVVGAKLSAALYLLFTLNDTRVGLNDHVTKIFQRWRKDALPINQLRA
jgi:hypothetical protein